MNFSMVEATTPQTAITKVLLADDHKLLRHAVRGILETTTNFSIVAETGTADDTLKLLQHHSPDILILDIGLPQRSGLDVLHEIKRLGLTTKIVILSMYDDEQIVQQSLLAGADGYLLKDFSPDEFLSALNKVMHGGKFVPQKFAHLLTNVLGKVSNAKTKGITSSSPNSNFDPLEKLSPRERQMFFLLVEGIPNRTIAKKLFISPRTVETHRSRVIKKLKLGGNADLIRYAIKHGLVIV